MEAEIAEKYKFLSESIIPDAETYNFSGVQSGFPAADEAEEGLAMGNIARKETVAAMLRGLLAAVLATVLGMALLSCLVVYGHLGDGTLMMLNQALKLGAVFLGVWTAVGPGGRCGFALGAVIGLVYIALGYGICALWDGLTISGWMLAVEFLTGAMLGGISGALIANLPERRSSARRRRARA